MKTRSDRSSVCSQLAGKRILITGTTGFLAKVLLEKLIRDVPDAGKFILLIRGNKKYPTAAERFEREILGSSIFEHLRREYPDYLASVLAEKIACVTGEVTEPSFGLAPAEFARLAGQVDIVVNAAASVNFREELDQALSINALSLLNLTELVKRAGDVPLIQVSTCYVNGYNSGDMYEQMVTPAKRGIPRHPGGYFEVDTLITELQQQIAEVKRNHADPAKLPAELTDLGIREANHYGWNDTYTFTKWIGEQIAARELLDGTLTIVRPSIIESTLREPAPGWIEGVKVGDAVILAYARGKTRFFPAKPDEIIDVIPADLVANSIILSMAEALADRGQRRVYQCCSGSSNPIILGDMIDILQTEAKQNWQSYEKLFYRQPKHDFRTVSRGTFLAAMGVAKLALGLAARARRLLGMSESFPLLESFNTTHNLAVVFSFYTSPSYTFQNGNLLSLAERMGDYDRRVFSVDPKQINWKQYLGQIHLAGLNRYALKDRRRGVAALNADTQARAKVAEAAVR